MPEGIDQAVQNRTSEGRFVRQEVITPLTWAKVELEHPDIISLYSSVPISLLVEKKPDSEHMVMRRNTDLVTVLKQRYGIGMPVRRMAEMAVTLGLSTPGVHIITEATARCISEDTSIELPYSHGTGVQAEALRVRKIVENYKKLKQYLGSSENIPVLEKVVIEKYLAGDAPTTIALALNVDMELPSGMTASQKTVLQILDRILGRVDYTHPSRLINRSLRAKEVLAEAVDGNYINRKAQATEEVLDMLSHGSLRTEILTELSLEQQQYSALINEAILELQSDPQGRRELQDIYDEATGGGQLKAGDNRTKNLIARMLLDPYREFRRRLGEETTSSGMLTAHLLSNREKLILERISQGSKQSELASLFSSNPGYITEAAHWLLGETDVHGRTERLQERLDIFKVFNNDLKLSVVIPPSLLALEGIPTIEILTKLAAGKKFSDISSEIKDSTGKHISEGRLLVHYQKVRGYYKMAGGKGAASLK